MRTRDVCTWDLSTETNWMSNWCSKCNKFISRNMGFLQLYNSVTQHFKKWGQRDAGSWFVSGLLICLHFQIMQTKNNNTCKKNKFELITIICHSNNTTQGYNKITVRFIKNKGIFIRHLEDWKVHTFSSFNQTTIKIMKIKIIFLCYCWVKNNHPFWKILSFPSLVTFRTKKSLFDSINKILIQNLQIKTKIIKWQSTVKFGTFHKQIILL